MESNTTEQDYNPRSKAERERIEQAIAALKVQRAILGDEVVETTLAALRANLTTLQSGERRSLVTILFADVTGFTSIAAKLDAEDMQDIMHRLWSKLDQTILSYQGYIDKHIGDRVMAVWGVTQPLENDPENAARAALQMQAELAALRDERGLSLSMRIGINTGLASIGHIASTGELNIIGGTVNLASRLEEAADSNKILISQDTHSQIRGLFDMQATPPLMLRGLTEPQQTYLLLRARERAFHMETRGLVGITTRTVGRDTELFTLQTAYRQACSGMGLQWVTLSGVAGIGKSRLMTDFANWIRSLPDHVRFLQARAWPQTIHSPYSLLRNLLTSRCQISDNDPLNVARKKLTVELIQVLGTATGERTAAFIGQLIGFDFSHSRWIADRRQDSQRFQREAETLARRYLGQLAAEPTVMLLEDLQWADEQSLKLLSSTFQDQHPWQLAVIGVARPLLWTRDISWGQYAHHQRIDLLALEDESARMLVSELLQKVDQAPQWLIDLLVEQGGGNPYFTEELVKWLIEQDMIEAGPTTWRVRMKQREGLRVPGTVQGVLQTRLEQLDHRARSALQRAAVIGLAFWNGAIDYLGQERVLPEQWIELEQRGLVVSQINSQVPGEDEYHFTHTLLRDVVYEYTLKKERQVFHERAAEWLSQVAPERSDEWAAVIATHYEQAGQSGSAADWYQRAGKQAQDIYARKTAIDYFRKALGLLPPPEQSSEQRVALYNRLGEMLRLEARFWEATEAYIGVLAAAGVAGDQVSQTHAWQRAFLSLEDTGAAIALGVKDAELDLLGETKRLAALKLNLLGAVYQLLECHGKADPYMASTLSLLQEPEQALDDDIDGAIALCQQSLDIATKIANPGGQMLCLTNLGQARIKLGEYRTAIDDLLQVTQMAEKIEWYAISDTHRLLAEAYLRKGQVTDALDSAKQALTWARAIEHQVFIGRAWLTLGRVASRSATAITIASTSYDPAACFANGVQALRAIEARAERGHALLVWAKYELEQGDRQQGEEMWQRGTRTLAQLGIKQPKIEEI